jgi:DNA-binding NarL/FixJ family response regulator
MTIRIFVADDHDIVREGVKSLLKSCPEWTICGEASDGTQAASLIGKIDCDIAIPDISMPGQSGLEVVASVSRQHPGEKILIFTMHSCKTLHSAARGRRPRGWSKSRSLPAI